MKSQQTWLILFILLVASGLSVGLVVARYMYTGYLSYHFLIWNLFLAWIPLGIAWFMHVARPPLLLLLPLMALWLLFFPNAPYIMTDLIHLTGRHWSNEVLWLDLVMILSFGLTGLFAGFTSLAWVQGLVRERLNVWASWLFVFVAMGLSGAGVYIGRFLRWNSWDIVTRPRTLLSDIVYHYIDPNSLLHTWSLTLLFTFLFLFAYIMATILPSLTATPRPLQRS